MKTLGVVVAFGASAVFLQGCCSARTNLLPKGSSEAVIVSTSSSADCCLKKAKEEAEEYCKSKSKSLAVIDEKTDYQGADKTAKAAISAVKLFTGSGIHPTDGAEDYRTTLKFKCE